MVGPQISLLLPWQSWSWRQMPPADPPGRCHRRRLPVGTSPRRPPGGVRSGTAATAWGALATGGKAVTLLPKRGRT